VFVHDSGDGVRGRGRRIELRNLPSILGHVEGRVFVVVLTRELGRYGCGHGREGCRHVDGREEGQILGMGIEMEDGWVVAVRGCG
jgi:hypothetical protein